jgi:hypothetical protein
VKPRPVMVIWDDASVTMEGETLEPERTTTIGYLVANKKSGLQIATDWCHGMEVYGDCQHFIPRPMLVDWWYLDIAE